MALQEINKAHRFLLFGEVKVHAVSEGNNVKTVGVRIVLEQQLFQIIERPFVRNPLPNLHHSMPRTCGKVLLAVLALLIADCKLNQSSLVI